MGYTPTESDITWAQDLLKLLKDGAIWTAPRFGTYRVDHTNKKLVLIESWGPETFYALDVAVFRDVGYEVTKEQTCG